MAVPKKKTTRARRNKRRTAKKIKRTALVLCPNCKKSIPPHTACPFCGIYRGRTILDLEAKERKKKAKKKKKQKSGS